jgi:hypothetical protein
MFVCSCPSMEKRSRSFTSEETFHQKLNVIGPVTEVSIHADALWAINGLRAASMPSRLTAPWPTQPGAPFVVQIRPGVSSAVASGILVNTVSVAFVLVAEPRALLTVTR